MKLAQIGTITPPSGTPNVGDDPTNYIASAVSAGISLLLIVSFLAMFIWTIFAGIRFVTSGGDEKTTSQAWSSIYWGILGMAIVLSSYAIVRLVEIFFHVDIITGGLKLPTVTP